MTCIDCGSKIVSRDDLRDSEATAIDAKRVEPVFSLHWWCNKPDKPICVAHHTPPGLKDLEKYGLLPKWKPYVKKGDRL